MGAAHGEGDTPFALVYLDGLRGEVAQMRFFNHALADGEIRDHYNAMLDPVGLGITSVSGAAVVAGERPSYVSEGALESTTEFFVIEERTDVLEQPLTLDIAATSLGGDTLAAGTAFTSYLMHFDPEDASDLRTAVGTVTFATPILGFLTGPESLAATDSTLGSIGRYDVDSQHRAGLATIAPGGFSATIALSALGDEVTQLRVLTQAVHVLGGDYNGDLRVDQRDLDLVLLHWGADGTVPPSGWTTNQPGGLIGQAQLDGLLLNWGASISGATAATPAPEPGGLFLAAILLLFGGFWKSAHTGPFHGPSSPQAIFGPRFSGGFSLIAAAGYPGRSMPVHGHSRSTG
jgi:hypothetical protein